MARKILYESLKEQDENGKVHYLKNYIQHKQTDTGFDKFYNLQFEDGVLYDNTEITFDEFQELLEEARENGYKGGYDENE